jgi:hypothetical protein
MSIHRRLESILALRPAEFETALEPGTGIPVLPPDLCCVQTLRARIAYMNFQNGTGVRFLTDFRGDASPITDGSVFYTFQGLTADGRYYVSVRLPVSHPSLPDDPAAVPGVDDYASFAENSRHAMGIPRCSIRPSRTASR